MKVTICMPLEDEGTNAWAPIQAEDVGGGLYRICGEMPSDQFWRFVPGAIVKTEMRRFSDGSEGLIAVENSNYDTTVE